ncbi:hypothetical protein HT576_08670 [Haloterrigena sp. SYSU A121-1]|uniref:Uncharacterized protein n=1 Tax=Haloterrigena gelatinilytica TaxID=2741724 RepID=A0A8J8KFJ7_9EURY|nr:hypothetical protein [Haloterrigena gelatinilytica]NUB91092.1 hypothetical protein [Haloterrigena gelatinilytica]
MADDEMDIGELATLAEQHGEDPVKQDELDEAQEVDEEHLRNASSISSEINDRMSDVSSLHRAAMKQKETIADQLDTLEEMKDDEEVFEKYIMEDPDARRYVTNLLNLIEAYQVQIDNLVPANMILFSTAEQLEEVVQEQQLRHDESFVLKHSKEVVQDISSSFEDAMQSVKQSHESSNEELLKRFDRMMERHSQLSDNQVKLQETMVEMVALLQEFASEVDTARADRMEQKLQEIEASVSSPSQDSSEDA